MDPLTKEGLEAALEGLVETFNTESAKKADARDADLMQSVDKKIQDFTAQLEEKRAQDNARFSLPGTEHDPNKDMKDQMSLLRYAYGVRTGDWDRVPLEKEVRKEMVRKATADQDTDGTSGSSTLGSSLIPEEQSRDIIEMARDQSVVMQAGARQLNFQHSSPHKYPRKTGASTANWTAESATIAQSGLTWDQVSLTPNKLAALTVLSNEVLLLADPGIEALVREDFAETFALEMDRVALEGSGSGSQPQGVANYTYVAANPSALGTAAVYDEYADMVHVLRGQNLLKGNLAWIMHPNQWNATVQMKDLTLQQLNRRALGDSIRPELLGFPVYTTTQISETTVGASAICFFGNWSDLLVATWKGLDLFASEHRYAEFDQTMIRATMQVDIKPRHEESFVINS